MADPRNSGHSPKVIGVQRGARLVFPCQSDGNTQVSLEKLARIRIKGCSGCTYIGFASSKQGRRPAMEQRRNGLYRDTPWGCSGAGDEH